MVGWSSYRIRGFRVGSERLLSWVACGVVSAVFLFAASGCAGDTPRPAEPVVFAAASLTDIMLDLAAAFQKKTGIRVKINSNASSNLARSIHRGAPADLFVSAHREWIDYLRTTDGSLVGEAKVIAGNRLVLIAAPRLAVADQPGPALLKSSAHRVALGDPEHVPAGKYARQSLQNLGYWEPIQDRIIPAASVRDALRLVAAGEVALGVVYRTDALVESRVAGCTELPNDSHEPIAYYALLMSQASPAAAEFLAFMLSDEGAAVFEQRGFIPRDGA